LAVAAGLARKELRIATIAFLIEHEEGHLHPTFRLARKLAVRGHRIVYLGLADGADLVRGQGFEFVPILEEVFPPGTIRTLRAMARTGEAAGGTAEIDAASRAGPGSIYARSWRGILGDEALDRTICALRPDLFILTSFYAPHALVLRHRYHLPIVLLTTILRTFPKSEYAAELGRLLLFSGEAAKQFSALVAGEGQAVRAAALAPRILAQVLRMRELILCPRELELPGQSHDGEPEVRYVEPMVDLERRAEGAFPREALDPSRRLLYISLGSQSHRLGLERATGFLRAAAEAFRHRPEWQVVLSTGALLDPAEISMPPGGIATSWAPQLELLGRAAVMVTHAGLGTVKECILCGVPMVVFPIDNDQPGNARRVVHHGLGVGGDLRSFSAGSIAALVEQADRPAVRDNMDRMQRCFLDAENAATAVGLIEELLAPAAG
jgi:zeaxanthin glucosyltransferase